MPTIWDFWIKKNTNKKAKFQREGRIKIEIHLLCMDSYFFFEMNLSEHSLSFPPYYLENCEKKKKLEIRKEKHKL